MSRQQIIETLRQHIDRLEATKRPCEGGSRSSGCEPLDRLLPGHGFPNGTLVEWLARGEASGAGTLALMAARQAAANGGFVVVLDRRRSFYPPAAAALGLELERVIVVRAASAEDELWALDQSLRCTGVVAVWGTIEKLSQRWFRRLQLAAESGGGVGHLLRPARVRGWPSWSYAQLWVEPRPARNENPVGGVRQWHVELIRCHGSAHTAFVNPTHADSAHAEQIQGGSAQGGSARKGGTDIELDGMTGLLREAEIRETPLRAFPAEASRLSLA